MRSFAMAYVGEANGNGTEAARIAGYKGNDTTLAAVSYENLRKPQIASLIEQLRSDAESKLRKPIFTAAQVLEKLTDIASADWRDFVQVKYNDSGDIVSAILPLKDQLKALELLGKYHALYSEKLIVSELDREFEERLALLVPYSETSGASEAPSETVN